jgi:hypothetical protein
MNFKQTNLATVNDHQWNYYFKVMYLPMRILKLASAVEENQSAKLLVLTDCSMQCLHTAQPVDLAQLHINMLINAL